MLEAFTRWWLTEQNNWVAGLMFTFLIVVLVGLSLWAHANTGAWGLPVAIFLGGLAAMAVVSVVAPAHAWSAVQHRAGYTR